MGCCSSQQYLRSWIFYLSVDGRTAIYKNTHTRSDPKVSILNILQRYTITWYPVRKAKVCAFTESRCLTSYSGVLSWACTKNRTALSACFPKGRSSLCLSNSYEQTSGILRISPCLVLFSFGQGSRTDFWMRGLHIGLPVKLACQLEQRQDHFPFVNHPLNGVVQLGIICMDRTRLGQLSPGVWMEWNCRFRMDTSGS